MAAETTTFRRGGVTYPLAPSSGGSTLLADADPATSHVLGFLAYVLDAYMGTRVLAEAAACGAPISETVAYQLPDDPSDYLTEEQVKFPLLAAWRMKGQLRDRTVTWRNAQEQWSVAYVLPPLTAGQREALVPCLRAARDIIDDRLEQACDPGYLSGARILGSAYANLEAIWATDFEISAWEVTRDLVFPALVITLDVRERADAVAGAYAALGDVDVNFDNTASGEDTLSDVVQTRTDTSP